MREQEYTAGIGDAKRVVRQRSPSRRAVDERRIVLRWTPITALAALVAAALFTWGFVHVILLYVFPAGPVPH
ncbi:hypothetical protein WK75_07845 [Burkholderia ubonensis]|nr:hypothetical protein WK75_07845 [Burkholderia ubonensis]